MRKNDGKKYEARVLKKKKYLDETISRLSLAGVLVEGAIQNALAPGEGVRVVFQGGLVPRKGKESRPRASTSLRFAAKVRHHVPPSENFPSEI